MRFSLLFLMLLLTGNAFAHTVDFSSGIKQYYDEWYDANPIRFRTQGFDFYSPIGQFLLDGRSATWLSSTTITASEPQAFDFLSIDLLVYYPNLGSGTNDVVTITGTYAGGGQVSMDLDVYDTGFATYSFDSSWSNLSSVVFGASLLGSAISMDNMVVASRPVPVPAAVWLFGSALAGLGWMRRKQTV